MSIKLLWIEEGCTACGLCEDVCPAVFKIENDAEVIPGANFDENEDCIIEASESCPVDVIKYE